MRKTAALRADPVTEHREQRLYRSLTADIIVEDVVDDQADRVKHLAVHGIGMVIARVIGDIKVIAPAAVILGIHAVQSIRDLGEDIRPQRGLGPCREDLAGCDVLDIVRKRHGDILGGRVRRAEVNGDIGRYGRQQHSH